MCLTTRAEKCFDRTQHTFFTWKDRPGSLPANKRNPRSYISALPKIQISNGTLFQKTIYVLTEIHSYYNKLYQKSPNDSANSLHSFLEWMQLPTLHLLTTTTC